VHHVPPSAESFARAGLVADRDIGFWHSLRITLGFAPALKAAGFNIGAK
jgi:hypothetical protein